MSDQSIERPAAPARRAAEVSIDNLTLLLGAGAIVAAVVGGSCSTNARIGDVQAELGTVRAELGAETRAVRTELGAEIRDVRAELGAEIRDVRAEVRGVRARVERLEDSTAASFATVHRQFGAVAVCILEIRDLVGNDADGGPASAACDSAVRAILAPSAATGP